ncbi:glycosyl hydrolase [Dyella monticola]|uniref:Glycosyl hydrolase n=1 Tax=Dyella monticola TaxID=1927958 RepID=A0A370WYA9_9GAMM|nr:glycosyl hydrolase 115 family protein [Dyella monticola]RDS81153.1 glycosyl hydrolase [Dyella monticola]
MSRRFKLYVVFALAIAFRPGITLALGEPSYISTAPVRNGFALVQHGVTTPLLVSDADWPGVVRAVGDLSQDIQRVTGRAAPILKNESGQDEVVLIGTIGKSPLIDALIKQHKLDVHDIAGRWESAVTTVVEQPLPGIKRALVIAGADKRGTIYGIYDLSEQIGVSPWYWWADVRVPHQDALYVLAGRYVQPVPAVKYRGIFFNDEAPALSGWTKEKFGGMNHQFYTKVFELLLRLKANFLWPAMWNNAFATDDPLNAKLADEYGIVMGTSHEEPMMRAEKEWTSGHHGPWDYTTNAKEIDDFWRKGMARDKNYEEVVTLGMRGEGDTPMSASANTQLLERIVADQRDILKQTVNPDVSRIPQVWALYKEVQEYYEKGMRVPDDVTLLWSDDNWGNLRRLPTAQERKRSGGAGIYYHFDYVGGPRSYKWLNTNPITKVQEQMHLALEYGADRLWVVNVGDGKPMEFPIEFFLDYARMPQRWNKDHLDEFTKLWAARDFGSEHADEIAEAMETYSKYNGRRKPELIDPGTFSLANYHEADRVEGEWRALAQRVDELAMELPENERAAYFELIQYPVDACANLTGMYITAARNAADAQAGNPRANREADEVRTLFAKDAALSDAYNTLLDGKWNHMMDQTHIGYTSWRDPPVNVMPAVSWIQVPKEGSLGVRAEDATPVGKSQVTLGTIDSVSDATRTLTLFDRGLTPVRYKIVTGASWLAPSETEGTVGRAEQRVALHVDWSKLPAGADSADGVITVTSDEGKPMQYTLHAQRLPITRETAKGFVESDGYVAMEAADTSARTADGASLDAMHWTELPDYGETKSAMTVFPVTATGKPDSAASLQYDMYLYDTGDMQLQLTVAPTQNFVPGRGLRFAVSVDDGPRTVVDALEHNTKEDWAKAVTDGVRRVTVPLTIAAPGYHTLKIWAVDPALVVERLVVSHGALRPSYLGPPESFHPKNVGAIKE